MPWLWGQPVGLTTRVANTTLDLPPGLPVYGYATTNAFPNLRFTNAVVITAPPGETNRLFVAEQAGRIVAITNLAAPTRAVFLDLTSKVQFRSEEGLLGLAFHPGYATNRYFYLFYTLYTNQTIGLSTRHDRLSRFETSAGDPAMALPESELVLLNQRDEAANHNGGDLHFGPDGYLYVSLGDEGGGGDSYNNSQRIDKDFFSGILRIDVDHRPGSLPPTPHPANGGGPDAYPYAIPPDNPFVGATNFNGQPVNPNAVRTEFWAVGLRNPWRMSFDPETGDLYCGDVGQNAYEEINIITRGGNYGWAYREGLHAGPKPAPSGFTSAPPIQEYRHGSGTNEGQSVTGGIVYRGSRFPDLYGAYLFADYVSGNIWSLRYDVANGTTNITPFTRIAGNGNIAAFGRDPVTGDVLMGDLGSRGIRRLIKTSPNNSLIPPTLADTGAFSDLSTLTPNPGILPYDINVPFWSDHAIKSRWFSIPLPNHFITFSVTNTWSWPARAIWIKHFELELTNGVAASRRRIETRFLVRDLSTAPGLYGITYRWPDNPTNATLVGAEGLDETFLVFDGSQTRTQTWHYPSRNECLVCHRPSDGVALGMNTHQLNRDFNYSGIIENQLQALNRAGYFSTNISSFNSLPALASATDESQSIEWRARSYLMANCGYCHNPQGSGRGAFDLQIFSPLSTLNVVDGPLADDLGDPDNRVVRPGSISHSVILTRMLATNPAIRMPPLASSLVDSQGVGLLSAWITNSLAGFTSLITWQSNYFGTTLNKAAPTADPDQDGALNLLEYLVSTNPTNSTEFWPVLLIKTPGAVAIQFPRVANRGFEVQWSTNLAANSSWHFLDVPQNRPFFAATNNIVTVPIPDSDASMRLFRVRVYEP